VGAPARGLGLGSRSLAVKKFQPIDKIDLLDVSVNAFLPSRASILCAITTTEAFRLPARLWVAFCGNGSLALDWTTILAGYPNANDAFLLVDYPGYGKCTGYATTPAY
jgi:hypothetical protein